MEKFDYKNLDPDFDWEEMENSGEWTKNFLELSEIELEVLKDRIKDNNGLIRIFVHPYYQDPPELQEENGTESAEGEDIKKKKRDAIERVLSSRSEKVPPIFAMETEGCIDRFKIRVQNIAQNVIYIIPTYNDTAEPKFVPKGTLGEENIPVEENWEKFINKLQNLGVEKIIIGGMNLAVGHDIQKKKPKLWHCVGDTINHLSKDFKVEISNLNFPSSRKDFKAIEEEFRNYKQKDD